MANKNVTIRETTKEGNMNTMPKGAKILGKETTVEVEQIENGFLIIKRTEVKYAYKTGAGDERTDYYWETKKMYSKEDPVKINTEQPSLADIFK